MSDLLLKYAGNQNLVMEYGDLMEVSESFLVLVPEEMHFGNPVIAMAIVANDPALTSSAKVNIETAVRLNNGDFRVTGTRIRMNVARRQDNFRLVSRSAIESVETATDIAGNPLTVTFNGIPQNKKVEKSVPIYDLSCVGIRDITPFGTVARLLALWTGGVNVGIFNAFENAGIGSGGLMCVGVECDPHSDNGIENKYRIQFRFVGSRDGFEKAVYWTDPDTGDPPTDLTPANWSALYKLQHEFDFQAAWPFGTDVGT